MSTKKISAGDTLTVGDLTDDHLGAEIELGPVNDITYRFELGEVKCDWHPLKSLWTLTSRVGSFYPHTPVKVITPPPVVQPDEPTVLGQCIRIEGLPGYEALVVDPSAGFPFLYRLCGSVWHTRSWEEILEDAGDRQIIVSDPPRWPDETPDVPERIEVGEWPDDDTHLRAWKWMDSDGAIWYWGDERKRWVCSMMRHFHPVDGPWTRGERVK